MTSQKNSLIIYCELFLVQSERAGEIIKPVVGGVVFNVAVDEGKCLRRCKMTCCGDGAANLEVGFAIQIASVNVAHALIARTRQQKKVGRKFAAVHNTNDIPDNNIAPRFLLELHGLAVAIEHEHKARVDGRVIHVPGAVFVRLAQHAEEDDDGEGTGRRVPAEQLKNKSARRRRHVLSRRRQVGEDLKSGHDEEKNVGEALKLLEQRFWDESDDGIL